MKSGKDLRLSQILSPFDGKGVILEADFGSILGVYPGLEDLKTKLLELSNLLDGVIVSIGQVDKLADVFKGKSAPSLILRSDWTNAYRSENYVLPATKLKYTLVNAPEDALRIGASALAAYYIVGYEKDEDEAHNMECIASLTRSCEEYGLPLLIQVLPIGVRVTKENYLDCVGLGVRQAVEAGGDIISAPINGGLEQYKRLVELAKTPLMVLEDFSPIKEPLKLAKDAVNSNASGIILGKKSLQLEDLSKALKGIHSIIHGE